MSKLMFGKLISKLQQSKSPDEREGKAKDRLKLLHTLYTELIDKCVCVFSTEVLTNVAHHYAFSCHQLGEYMGEE